MILTALSSLSLRSSKPHLRILSTLALLAIIYTITFHFFLAHGSSDLPTTTTKGFSPSLKIHGLSPESKSPASAAERKAAQLLSQEEKRKQKQKQRIDALIQTLLFPYADETADVDVRPNHVHHPHVRPRPHTRPHPSTVNPSLFHSDDNVPDFSPHALETLHKTWQAMADKERHRFDEPVGWWLGVWRGVREKLWEW